jgi:hypothetical protein
MLSYRSTSVLIASLAMMFLGAAASADEKIPSGTVEIDEVEVAFLLSGNLGGGKLEYKGKAYRFQIGGLGVGGIGASSIDANGEVYNLKNAADFGGAYGEARTGAVVGDKSTGDLWLENPKGVVLRLKAKRDGVMLTLGADAIVVKMEKMDLKERERVELTR